MSCFQDCKATPSAVHVCDKVPEAKCEDKLETVTKYVYEEECEKVSRKVCKPAKQYQCKEVPEEVQDIEEVDEAVKEFFCDPLPPTVTNKFSRSPRSRKLDRKEDLNTESSDNKEDSKENVNSEKIAKVQNSDNIESENPTR